MRRVDRGFDDFPLSHIKPERRERQISGQRIETPQYELFAEERWQRVHAIVFELAVRERQAQAPVLRHAPLRDVHARQHLDTRDERVAQMQRRPLQNVERAVDTQSDAPRVFRRLDVDIGRAARRGGAQGFGEQRDGGRVVGQGCLRRTREGGAGSGWHGVGPFVIRMT
ncbi:hypothetical protein AWB67_00629 [Caballeronia terrestris]|uniref:Uncharacterized protein n=1 Tax=Caballeronia terrestris TaxID=1226301 RepID=A0A158FHR8_9BURK|nr:hypothetical protein AWB67_00629 [Caballeronia terrestris]